MELLLLLWDEIDDWMAAARHLVSSAASEAAAVTAPLVTGASALGVWLLVPHARLPAALLGGAATVWGAVIKAEG